MKMQKAVLVIDMPENCSKCKFMYEFYGVKKCQLLNILQNGGKAIIPTDSLTSERKECCPLHEVPEKADIHKAKTMTVLNWCEGYNACIDKIVKGDVADAE